MDGIVDSCARIVEVDGRFEIELAESEIARVETTYSNRRERAEAIVRELQQSSRESRSNR